MTVAIAPTAARIWCARTARGRATASRQLVSVLAAWPVWLVACAGPAAPVDAGTASSDASSDAVGADQTAGEDQSAADQVEPDGGETSADAASDSAAADGAQEDAAAIDAGPTDTAPTDGSGGPDPQCLQPGGATPKPDGTPCDDGRACTLGDSCALGICKAGAQTCACEPGHKPCAQPGAGDAKNLCRGPDICLPQGAGAAQPFACVADQAATKVCDASLDAVCAKNACAPLTGVCSVTQVELTKEICDLAPGAGGKPGCRREVLTSADPQKLGLPCDDGLACSVGDSCASGACTAKDAQGCGCKTNADCPDNDDLCDGKPYCDQSGAVWSCKVNPGTIVACDSSGDTACQVTACELKTGACKKGPAPQGKVCDDGAKCTTGDACGADGKCVPGAWTCCKSAADCAGLEDGNLCNGTLFCNLADGECQLNPSTVIQCPSADDTACSKSSCIAATGKCQKQPVPDKSKCDDGDVCTDGDHCQIGTCKAGTDTCKCQSDADCKAKDDGDLCNGTLYCNAVSGACKPNPATVVTCQTVDDTACRRAQCQPKLGTCAMVDLGASTACDADGTACTANDACDGKGVCKPGTKVCICLSDADCGAQDDGDLCNGTLFCDKSGAKPACTLNPASVVSCPSVDNTACSKNLCNAKTGKCALTALPAGTACNDGEPCTGDDACDGGAVSGGKGVCKGGASLCACKVDVDCKVFDDGNACNGTPVCAAGGCVNSTTPLTCEDGNGCILDSCDKQKGCQHTPTTAPCDADDSVCTENDTCDGKGACKAGPSKVCDDKNDCTKDSCDAKAGCAKLPVANGQSCTQSKWGVCQAGACQPGLCAHGYDPVEVSVAGGKAIACAAVAPVWGVRPTTPKLVYTVQEPKPAQKVVVDSQTKLMWQQQVSAAKVTQDAAMNLCADANYGGFDDWRLPSRTELLTLLDYVAVSAPLIDEVAFPGTPKDWHWAATPLSGLPTHFWDVHFGTGQANYFAGSGLNYARCVRAGGGYDPPQKRFVVSAGGKVVTDIWLQREWQRDVAPSILNIADAIPYCKGLATEGKTGWRLPTVRELEGLVDAKTHGPALSTEAFPGAPAKHTWTGTSQPGDNTMDWWVSFQLGTVGVTGNAVTNQVRCIRDL